MKKEDFSVVQVLADSETGSRAKFLDVNEQQGSPGKRHRIVRYGVFQQPSAISGRTYLFLVLSGLGTGASWLCYFRALKLGNAGQVAPVDKLSVVLVAIFGLIFLGEKLSLLSWLGVALVAAGAILVAVG